MSIAKLLYEHFIQYRHAEIFVRNTDTGMIAQMFQYRGHLILRRLHIPNLVELFKSYHQKEQARIVKEIVQEVHAKAEEAE